MTKIKPDNNIYTPVEGESIEHVAHMMVVFAKRVKSKVVALFENVELYALPSTDPQEIVDYYKEQITKE